MLQLILVVVHFLFVMLGLVRKTFCLHRKSLLDIPRESILEGMEVVRGVSLKQVTCPADQEHFEVPSNVLAAADILLRSEILEDVVGGGPIYVDLCEQREGCFHLISTESLNLLVRRQFLISKLTRRKCKNIEMALLSELLLQFLQAGVVGFGFASSGRNVDQGKLCRCRHPASGPCRL